MIVFIVIVMIELTYMMIEFTITVYITEVHWASTERDFGLFPPKLLCSDAASADSLSTL